VNVVLTTTQGETHFIHTDWILGNIPESKMESAIWLLREFHLKSREFGELTKKNSISEVKQWHHHHQDKKSGIYGVKSSTSHGDIPKPSLFPLEPRLFVLPSHGPLNMSLPTIWPL
jgi:hypothetical protein